MSQRPDSVDILSPTITICGFDKGGAKGFWLYDKTRGINLAMRAESKEAALFEALEYYQGRLVEIERAHNCLQSRVNDFIAPFLPDDSDD